MLLSLASIFKTSVGDEGAQRALIFPSIQLGYLLLFLLLEILISEEFTQAIPCHSFPFGVQTPGE